MMVTKGFKAASAAGAFLAVCGIASAAAPLTSPQSTTFQVKLTIAKSCEIGSASDIDFNSSAGAVSVLTADLTASGTITVGCTKGTVGTVTLDPGSNALGGSRRMKSTTLTTAEYVNYNLYTDNGYGTVWDQSTTSKTVTGSGNISGSAVAHDQSLTIYAKVPAQNTASPDAYADTVTAYVSF